MEYRDNKGKPKMGFIPLWLFRVFVDIEGGIYTIDWTIFDNLARVYELGEKKYSRGSWLEPNGLILESVFDSYMRHYYAYLSGQEYDEESGINHLYHCMWNALAMLYLINGDDYPTEGFGEPLSALYRVNCELSKLFAGKTTNVKEIKERTLLSSAISSIYRILSKKS